MTQNKHMSYYKKRLVTLLFIQIFLVIVHKIYEPKTWELATFSEWPITYPLGLTCVVFLLFYAFSIQCPNCKKKQVFRGWSVFDLKWPQEICYSCCTQLKK